MFSRGKLNTLFIVGFVSLTCSLHAQQKKASSFALSIKGNVTVKAGERSQKLETDTKFAYTISHEKSKYQIQLDRAELEVNVDGKVIMSAVLSKDLFEDRANKRKLKADDAPEPLKKMLRDSYGTPIYEFEVDANFKETRGKVIARDGAKQTIHNGQVENARMFHQPFHAKSKTWKSKVKYALGNGNYATGELNFEKQAAQGDTVPVKVSGNLIPEGQQNNLKIKNGKYVVTGMQNFNTRNNEYESGEQNIAVSFDLYQGENKMVENTGKMTLTLKKTK